MLKRTAASLALALALPALSYAQRLEHATPLPPSVETIASTIDVHSDLMGAARVILPAGWTAYAQHGVDIHRPTRVQLHRGEPWTQALDRWLAQEALTARVDWQRRTFYLRAGLGTAHQAAAPAVYEVTSEDTNIREVLARWAQQSGWKHKPEHWTLGRDFPVEGTAGADVFGHEFTKAVQTLMRSTELTDFPAQPCFYSNHVVRVIPATGICADEQ